MKIQATFLGLALLVVLVGQASAQDRLFTGFPELPKDAGGVAERFVGCVYFSGEITGSDAERDAQINQSMRELKCSSVGKDLKRIRAKYKSNSKVLAVLKELD